MQIKRAMTGCDWNTTDPAYLDYHDTQWGVPLHDDGKLFEKLILEGAQAGLSWITILKRREGYRAAYDGFDPEKMARWDDEKMAELAANPAIIRNRLKIESARKNARVFLEVVEASGSFDAFIWSFVAGKTIQNAWRTMDQVPTVTPASTAMAKALKKKGFTFVGPTICYAYMQSVGMVNDHLTSCFRYETIKNMG